MPVVLLLVIPIILILKVIKQKAILQCLNLKNKNRNITPAPVPTA